MMSRLRDAAICCWEGIVEGSDHVFGGWSNFTQGALGSILGVLGAVWLARRATSAEIERERERQRQERTREQERYLEASATAAASSLIRATLELEEQVKRVKWLRIAHQNGPLLQNRHLEEWQSSQGRFTREIAANGGLLPAALESEVSAFLTALDPVVYADYDEGMPVYVEAASEEVLDSVVVQADVLISRLQTYRRDPSSFV